MRTKFSIWWVNSQSSMNESFYSTNKTSWVFDVNKKSVLELHMIGKRHNGLSKVCSILGLWSPIVKSQLLKHVKYLEEKAFELQDEHLKMAATWACILIIKENNLYPSVKNVDVPTNFDGTWCLRGWTARKEVVAAKAEKTAQVINVSYRCKTCPM